MDNEEYKAIYKCRLCGEEFEDCTTGEDIVQAVNVALSVVGHTNHVKFARNIYKNTTHYCEDGSLGFADFQGFKKIEKDA